MGNVCSAKIEPVIVPGLKDSKFNLIVDNFDSVPILAACKNGDDTILLHLLDVLKIDPNIGYVIERQTSKFMYNLKDVIEFNKKFKCPNVVNGSNYKPWRVTYVDKYTYENPLHIACVNNQVEIVKILLSRKVDVNSGNGYGIYKQPFDNEQKYLDAMSLFAACNVDGNPDLVKLLLDSGTHTVEFINACILHVCENNNNKGLEILNLLVQKNMDLMTANKTYTPMPNAILIALTERKKHDDNKEITKLILTYSEFSLHSRSSQNTSNDALEVPIVSTDTPTEIVTDTITNNQ